MTPGWLKNRATIAVYRSRAVRESAAFCVRELRTGGIGEYRLRGGSGHVVLRHRTQDLEIFHELMVARLYDSADRVTVPEPRVLDLGGNIGLFGVRARAQWPGARITSVEPDPANLAILRRCVALNGGEWEVVPAFAGVATGSERFIASGGPIARRALPEEQEGVSEVERVDARPFLAEADVVKMDIEGAEWPLLEDQSWAEIRAQLVLLEYHRRPDGEQHERATAALEAAGLQWRRLVREDDLGLGVLVGWRDA